MPRKKVDERIRTLIENGVKSKQRSLIAIVGDHGKDQVANLHYILSKAQVKARPNVLWCYKKELGFSSHRQKRMRQIKKMVQRGLHDPEKDDPFELFISSTKIRWCYYKETSKILGQTYGMLVLQDFEALTPNLLARTIETVEGGGIVILLLRTVSSLRKLYSMTMDVHVKFQTDAHKDVIPRFNERFILSLANCKSSVVLDDELNVLPLSKHSRKIQPMNLEDENEDGSPYLSKEEKELRDLKESLADTQPAGALVNTAKTLDQAKAILTFVEGIAEKTLRSTVALTAARGRGKSAALGTAIAAAVAYGYSNIFVTAPSPENLGTVFDFIFKGFDALKYKEHLDYEIIQSTNTEYNKAVVRVNIFRDHRQTIQYIQPHQHEKLAQAELVAIDEAAAIPLPLVKKLLGPYLVFMSSTVNGYEGTGRSLSLKLIQKLREQQNASVATAAFAASASVHGSAGKRKGERQLHEERWQESSKAAAGALAGSSASGRTLREVQLETPIRYAAGDPVEAWLNELLCLDAKIGSHRLVTGTPHPNECELYQVDRDALFSYHKLSEAFLQRMMALYVSSHYKNQPNDLQLMSDAPAHQLFALLGPQAESKGSEGMLPDILCIAQVCLEGQIAKESVQAQLSRGQRASGDLIPWTVAQQFQDNEFASLSGARVVRIATHPDVQHMGYGSRVIGLLRQFYEGKLLSIDDDLSHEGDEGNARHRDDSDSSDEAQLLTEKIKPRKKLPPLLVPVSEKRPDRLHWFGVSFGLTQPLFNFWSRAGFKPVYLRQTANELTGEHTAIMLCPLECHDLSEGPAPGWLQGFVSDFRKRFLSLLGGQFSSFETSSALSILCDAKKSHTDENQDSAVRNAPLLGMKELSIWLSGHDLKRLESYARNLVDYHMIVDLLPILARLYFVGSLHNLSLSYLQTAILVGLGLQHKTVDNLEAELAVPAHQLLALFNKSMRKISTLLRSVQEKSVEAEMEDVTIKAQQTEDKSKQMHKTSLSLREEQELAAAELEQAVSKKQKDLIHSLDLDSYAISGTDTDWQDALKGGLKQSISVRSTKVAEGVNKLNQENGGERMQKRKKNRPIANERKKNKKG